MDTTDKTPEVPVPADADGYYGEDDLDGEELDLSFLDEEEADDDDVQTPPKQ